MPSGNLGAVRFRDLDGVRYTIPEAVLATYELPCDLPDGVPLTGLEDAPAAHPSTPLPIRWHITASTDGRSLQYVIASHEKDRPSTVVADGAIRVWSDDNHTVIEIVLPDGRGIPTVTATLRSSN